MCNILVIITLTNEFSDISFVTAQLQKQLNDPSLRILGFGHGRILFETVEENEDRLCEANSDEKLHLKIDDFPAFVSVFLPNEVIYGESREAVMSKLSFDFYVDELVSKIIDASASQPLNLNFPHLALVIDPSTDISSQLGEFATNVYFEEASDKP